MMVKSSPEGACGMRSWWWSHKTNRLKPLNYTLENGFKSIRLTFQFFLKKQCPREARCGCTAGRMAKKMVPIWPVRNGTGESRAESKEPSFSDLYFSERFEFFYHCLLLIFKCLKMSFKTVFLSGVGSTSFLHKVPRCWQAIHKVNTGHWYRTPQIHWISGS